MSDKVFDFDPHHLPDDVLKAIGLAIVCSSQTESVVSMGIAELLGMDIHDGAAVTAQISLPNRLSVFRSLLDLRIADAEARSEFEKSLLAVEKAIEARNAWAHKTLFTDPETKEVHSWKVTAKKKVTHQVMSVTAGAIEADARAIYEAGMDLMNLIGAIQFLLMRPDD